MSSVRGKFRLVEVAELDWNDTARKLTFQAVCNDTPENKRFHKYTPTGQISMVVDNPEAMKNFQLRKEYYVDFTEASPQTA